MIDLFPQIDYERCSGFDHTSLEATFAKCNELIVGFVLLEKVDWHFMNIDYVEATSLARLCRRKQMHMNGT